MVCSIFRALINGINNYLAVLPISIVKDYRKVNEKKKSARDGNSFEYVHKIIFF